jgi:tetrathionate reductase subunit B
VGKKVFVVDVARCNGCYCCQIACKDEHVGNDWSPYAKPQPDTGQFWCRLNEYTRGTVPKVKLHSVPALRRGPLPQGLPRGGRHLHP